MDSLLAAIHLSESTGVYPNIFCDERLLIKNSLNPFNDEMRLSNKLIFQGQVDIVDSYDNNLKNFISCFFNALTGSDQISTALRRINEKYIQNLNGEIDLLDFIKKLSSQLTEIHENESDFSYDVAMAAALYLSLQGLDYIPRIKRFVEQYHKFNQSHEDRHVYCVNSTLELNNSTPIALLETVEASLCLLQKESIPSLSLYLARDIKDYKTNLEKLVDESEADELNGITLNEFSRSRLDISPIEDSITVNEQCFKFENVNIINVVTMDIHKLEKQHTTLIESSAHIYSYCSNGSLYLIAIQNSISKIFISIQGRLAELLKKNNSTSYPLLMVTDDKILTLNNFGKAVGNITIHQDIGHDEAEKILLKWLKYLPSQFYQPIVTLIAAHDVMNEGDIQKFLTYVGGCLKDSESNAFLIKSLEDYSGSQRVIYTSDLARNAGELNLCKISEAPEKVTLITDIILSGTQVIDAIKFYVNNEGKDKEYFTYSESEKVLIVKKLKGIKKLDICSILCVHNAVDRIQKELRNLLNNSVEVNIICGRDIGETYLFPTSKNLGDRDKQEIETLLNDKENIKRLYDCLNESTVPDEINTGTANLVARYKSLPKKCFEFLYLTPKFNNGISPFVRVLEKYEKK